MKKQKQHTILIVDDEEQFRFMLRLRLEKHDFNVLSAESGAEALEMMAHHLPSIVLLDLNMPEMDGHAIYSSMKKDNALKMIPVIILTSSDDISDKLRGLENGADDYVTKYQDNRELLARIHTVLRRNEQNLDRNPLTGLPGNQAIQKQLLALPDAGWPWAVVYCDLDNFKAFNDYYGFSAGDDVIRFTADTIRRILSEGNNENAFLGHIGGDDFVFISSTESVSGKAQSMIEQFDAGITGFYSEEDRQRGFIESKDRQGSPQRFSFVALSMACITSRRPYAGVPEMMQILTEMKKVAKSHQGSYFAIDKRDH